MKIDIPLIFMLLITVVIFSCNPYKRLATHPPLSAHDSLNLSRRCSSVFPIDTVTKTKTIIIRGKDSSRYYKHLADSILKIKQVVLEKVHNLYKDTCTTAVNQYQDGYNLGYEVGLYDGKIGNTSDTILITKTITQIDNTKLVAANITVELKSKEAEKYRVKNENKSTFIMWLLIGFGVSILVNVLQFKKPLNL